MNEEEREIVKKFERLYLKDFNNEKITNEDRLSYIECVLISNLIEKLQKENEELKEELETEQNERLLCHIREKQMIPVQKIKGKIEELEEEKKYYYSQYKIEELNDKIQVLEELIEEREEK